MIQHTRRPIDRYPLLALFALLGIGLITACASTVTPEPTATLDPPTVAPSPTSTAVPTSTPTATPLPLKELTVCQAEEPNTLFIYGGPSWAARNVMDAIYDGPLDTPGYVFESVILEQLPSLEDGGAEFRTVEVGEGERVVSVDGEVGELLPDVTVRRGNGAEVVFGGDAITMTQLVVTFTLRADVQWSDGEPLTSADSRFSYELAGQLDDAALQRRLERTASYEALDSRTVVWTGVPGYRDPYYLLNFYHPLPEHVLGGTRVETLLEADVVHHRPLGWGPFVVETWAEGDHITLVRNAHYFRASEGLPHLDRVTFRFVDDPQRAMDDLLSGSCDIVTEDLISATAPDALMKASGSERLQLISAPSSEWEHLDFGIQPARWSGRVTFFDDREVRQGLAHCVDRERIAAEAFPYTDPVVAHSYVPPEHPLHAGEALRRWSYDPATGGSMLEAAGWQDADGDGLLEAQGLPDVASGTVFSVTLLTTEGDPARRRAAQILRRNLADCGVGLTIEYLPPDVFYADGPDGPVFGRQFDLALFSWLNGLDAPCGLYLSTNIPTEENWWSTSNNPGYASEAYDEACRSALSAPYGTATFMRSHQEAQRVFAEDLPVLPLYFVPRAVAVGPEVEGVVLDPGQRSLFWNIESIDLRR